MDALEIVVGPLLAKVRIGRGKFLLARVKSARKIK
jgi:hypothetical protein